MNKHIPRQCYTCDTATPDLVSVPICAPAANPWDSRRLWSLWDMIKQSATSYLRLGMEAQDFLMVFYSLESRESGAGIVAPRPGKHIEDMAPSARAALRKTLGQMVKICGELGLSTAQRLAASACDDPPETEREFRMIVDAVRAGLDTRIFLSIPQHLTGYYESDELVSDAVKIAFPTGSTEIRSAGNSLATDLPTACVFHAMRAAEIGVRVLCTDLKAPLKHPVELSEWNDILRAIELAIKDIENQPKTDQRTGDLEFYGMAAAQFRFFKDGWRIHVAHARATYNESQAKDAIDHVRSFFEILATRLKE